MIELRGKYTDAKIIFLAFLIGLCVLVVVGYGMHLNNIPKGCAEVSVPNTCHIETRMMMVGKTVTYHNVEVCDHVIACYNGSVLREV